MSGAVVLTCPRCGARRKANTKAAEGLCRDCWLVEPDWPDVAVPAREGSA